MASQHIGIGARILIEDETGEFLPMEEINPLDVDLCGQVSARGTLIFADAESRTKFKVWLITTTALAVVSRILD